MECCGFKSHPRQLIFSRKSDCLGCAVLLFVCLFDLACFFLSSFSSLIKNMYVRMYVGEIPCGCSEHVGRTIINDVSIYMYMQCTHNTHVHVHVHVYLTHS